MAADTPSTLSGLGVSATEGNPVVRAALRAGPAGLVVVKLPVLGLALACRVSLSRTRRLVAPAALALVWRAAAGLNVVLLL